MQFYGEFYLLLGGHHETNTEAFSKCLKKPNYPHFNSGFTNHLNKPKVKGCKCNIGTLVQACTQLPIICNSINAKCNNSLIRLFASSELLPHSVKKSILTFGFNLSVVKPTKYSKQNIVNLDMTDTLYHHCVAQ